MARFILPSGYVYELESGRDWRISSSEDWETIIHTPDGTETYQGDKLIDHDRIPCAVFLCSDGRYRAALKHVCRVSEPADDNQPQWRTVANLGDAQPIEFGGKFVLVDDTGSYPAELEILEPDNTDGEDIARWTVYRFVLEPCTLVNGVLSDNPFHPDHPAWFATPEEKRADRPQDSTYLSNVASSVGIEIDELRALLCDADPIKRAWGYLALCDYHGIDNFDEYPLTFDDRAEIESRYPEFV